MSTIQVSLLLQYRNARERKVPEEHMREKKFEKLTKMLQARTNIHNCVVVYIIDNGHLRVAATIGCVCVLVRVIVCIWINRISTNGFGYAVTSHNKIQ